MNDSKNILLVTNSTTEEEIFLVKDSFIKAASQSLRIRLSLVHVIPNLPTCYFNIPSMAQLAEQYYSEAKQCLTLSGESLGVAKKDQWLITGRIKTEVLRLANKLGAQFILASSISIREFHKAILTSNENQQLLFNKMSNLAASNF